MRITTTTSVSYTKTEALDTLLKASGIELREDQTATLKFSKEPFERYVIWIDTKEKE